MESVNFNSLYYVQFVGACNGGKIPVDQTYKLNDRNIVIHDIEFLWYTNGLWTLDAVYDNQTPTTNTNSRFQVIPANESVLIPPTSICIPGTTPNANYIKMFVNGNPVTLFASPATVYPHYTNQFKNHKLILPRLNIDTIYFNILRELYSDPVGGTFANPNVVVNMLVESISDSKSEISVEDYLKQEGK